MRWLVAMELIFLWVPIKTIARCLIKAQPDYHNAKTHCTVLIVNLVGCSITFDKNKTDCIKNGLSAM